MNLEHLRAFLWLHSRLRLNQLKKGGIANVVVLALVAVSLVFAAVGFFFGGIAGGVFGLGDAAPAVVMYVWDALVVFFLFAWSTTMLADVQRSEAIALEKFLHLPVSLAGAFFLNYLSSLFSVTLVLFLAQTVGLTIGLAISRGPAMLFLFPLLAAFVLMLSALTYQFQGWLASLMANPRRRRTIVVFVTAAFILVLQLPNLINMMRSRMQVDAGSEVGDLIDKERELGRAAQAKEITMAEYTEKVNEIRREREQRKEEAKARDNAWHHHLEEVGDYANMLLPPGWLPLGARALAEGEPLPVAGGFLGMALIGAISLRRAYRTTVQLYTGHFTAGKKLAAPVAAPPPVAAKPAGARANFLERRLPWLSEAAAVVALGGFRGLVRAPEVKMLLIAPVFLTLFMGAIFLNNSVEMPMLVRPLLALGGLAVICLTLMQLLGNQFGYDRAGFRVFVLSPAPRRDILLGKNLAVAPLAAVLGVIPTILVEVIYPLRIDHLLALLPHAVSMYLLFCLVGNTLSIFAPLPVAAGTMKPTSVRIIPMLIHSTAAIALPTLLVPTLLPLGIEFGLEALGWPEGLPVYLVLSVVMVLLVSCFYRLAIGWQGSWLQARELKILDVVVAKE